MSSVELTGLGSAVLGVVGVTLLIFPLKQVITAPALDALYIPVVLWLAAKWGMPIGVFASVLGALAFSFFHISPVHTFDSLDSEGVAFLAVAVGAIYVAHLSGRARSAEEHSRQEAIARGRAVAAADEERRRVVRDLHDGAQQRLVHAVIVLRLALGALQDIDPETRELLQEALHHTEQANSELRDLAHGILPSVLTRGGLIAGVRAVVSRMTLPVTVDVPNTRLPPAVEAAAYFVVSEALTNVVKHASAHSAAVSAHVERGELQVEVTDDGIGGAHGKGTNGLAGLSDRVSALGGRLIVDSPKGKGTRIRAFLPLPNGR